MSLTKILLNNIETEIANNNVETIGAIKKADNAELQAMHHRANADHQARKSRNLSEGNKQLEEENKQLKEENEFYKNLLSKPMAEIAKEHGDFREIYQKQQELLATWIVSQRAFKEIAIKYGALAGKNKNDITDEATEIKVNVLTDTTEHGNNIGKEGIDGIYIKEIMKRKKSR